jgi:hypothetical protein
MWRFPREARHPHCKLERWASFARVEEDLLSFDRSIELTLISRDESTPVDIIAPNVGRDIFLRAT